MQLSEQGKDNSKENKKEHVENKVLQSHLKPKISGDIPPPLSSWSTVVSHQSFLEYLDVMKTTDFARKMFDQLKKEATDRKGERIVDQTILYAIAALLKHLGLVEIARKFAPGSVFHHTTESNAKSVESKAAVCIQIGQTSSAMGFTNEKQSL
ncbi:hypothetical protein RFI_06395 [Reticulomyxa filosa]|uniref:Uncharacterized protein n=1 Tax=Reticulomyxa filosa TaxID=46433 RepID=X6NWM8_RETFI|nr:hypothetical protein RFI_06395 [Reticulomyxa filosa]|eukprot:ETO30725.1 hypothetical protein RFI_06395 [Reticulomyxa filosa]